jgi:hypothetical protein
MARKRFATFSVADHLDVRALAADVLLFDQLAIPYPAGPKDWDYWVKKEWDPKLLEYCLVELEDLALPIAWGKEERDKFRANIQNAEELEQLTVSPIKWMRGVEEAQKWEVAKQWTRATVGQIVQELRGTDFWMMPCYRSPDAFLRNQNARIAPADSNSRREALALLVGQKMRVPDSADPKLALRLAVELARNESYLRSRRQLFNWQEEVIHREQSERDDAQELDDLIAELNDHVAKTKSKTRVQWIFYALKRAIGMVENPVAMVANATIEGAEIITDREATPPGPMAAFHHVQKRVIEASVPRKKWKIW